MLVGGCKHRQWQTYSCEFSVRKQFGYTGDQSEQATVQNPKPQRTGTRSATSRPSTQAILRNPKERSMAKHKETNTESCREKRLARSKRTNMTSGEEERKTHTHNINKEGKTIRHRWNTLGWGRQSGVGDQEEGEREVRTFKIKPERQNLQKQRKHNLKTWRPGGSIECSDLYIGEVKQPLHRRPDSCVHVLARE